MKLKNLILGLLCLLLGNHLLHAQNLDKPNVLLIISDDLNTRIGPYMNLRDHTPHLDRLAAEGVQFSRTYCQYPLCGPSRASIMSGLHAETNGVMGNSHELGSFRAVNPRLANHPSLAGFFKENGYFSARVSKIFHMGVPGGIERGEPGGDDPASWDYSYNIMAPETLSDGELELLSPKNLHYGSNFAQMIIADELDETQADYMTVSQAIAILENRARPIAKGATNKVRLKPHAPFFLGVGLVRPHVPLIAPERCFEPYPATNAVLPEVKIGNNVPKEALLKQNERTQGMDEVQQKKALSAYMASVRFMDEQVGRLLDALDRLKIRENTIVVFISDHGYNLGEHDCWSKHSLWEGVARVPMIISDPKSKTQHGSVCENITSLIDLYPTLSQLCNLEKNQPKILQGKSRANLIRGNEKQKEEGIAYTITGKGASIRTPNWRYTRWGENIGEMNEELYDHQNDPEEFVNLADNPKYKKELERLRRIFEDKRNFAREGQ